MSCGKFAGDHPEPNRYVLHAGASRGNLGPSLPALQPPVSTFTEAYFTKYPCRGGKILLAQFTLCHFTAAHGKLKSRSYHMQCKPLTDRGFR